MGRSPTSFADLGLEHKLLVWLCSIDPRRRAGTWLTEQPIDWLRFMALVHIHRLAPLILQNLWKLPDLEIPAWVSQKMGEAHRQNALQSLRLASHLVSIVKALSAAGIPAIPLKGICLAARYYNHIAARHAGDIDLLVAPDQMLQANEVLLACGYHRVSKRTHTIVTESDLDDRGAGLHFNYISPDHVLLELHFRLHFNPGALRIPFAEILEDAASCPLADLSLPIMSDPLQFVFLCTHGARHEWERIQWLCDIAVMVHRATPDDLQLWLALARGQGLLNPVVQALILVEQMFGVDLPPDVTKAYSQSLRIRFMVRRAQRKILRAPDDHSDAAVRVFDPARRLYRLCVTTRPYYLWHEVRDAIKAYSALILTAISGRYR